MDTEKTHTYEQLCKILLLCLETGVWYHFYPDVIFVNYEQPGRTRITYEYYTNKPCPELDHAITDLINYKLGIAERKQNG